MQGDMDVISLGEPYERLTLCIRQSLAYHMMAIPSLLEDALNHD